MEFDTAVARVAAEDEVEEAPYAFTIVERDPDTDAIINRVECHAYRPEEGQFVVMVTDVMGRRATLADKIAGTVDFCTEILDEPSKDYVVRRLLDRRDPFGLAELQPIIDWLIGEWGGRPTKQPSDFARSRKSGGQSSTPRTRKSTSSGSRRTAS